MKFEKIVNQLSDRVTEAICRAHGRSDAALSFLLDADVARALANDV